MDNNETVETTTIEPAEPSPTPNKASKAFPDILKTAFSPKYRTKTICLLCIIALIVGALCWYLPNLSAKSVALRYMKADTIGDYNGIAALSAYDIKEDFIDELNPNYDRDIMRYWERWSENYDTKVTSWSSFSKAIMKQRKESFEKQYGKYKIEYKVIYAQSYPMKRIEKDILASDSLLAYSYDELEDYGFDPPANAKGMEVKIETHISGTDDINEFQYIVYMCKVKGVWKVITYDVVDWDHHPIGSEHTIAGLGYLRY